jgi:hypothetical protein
LTLQVYLPEHENAVYPNILNSHEPLVLQPSKAQVLNLKQIVSELRVSSRALSKQTAEFPRRLAIYELCNSSVTKLLAPGQSPACAALVKLLFPSSAVTNPSGLPIRLRARA